MPDYTCDPDCDERTNCETAGELGHFACGRCPECGEPKHHGCIGRCRAIEKRAKR